MNTYSYVGGNPIIRIDPLGLFDGSSTSCYAVGMRIVCVSGQRPPPANGILMPDSTLSCKTKCNIKFGAICAAAVTGVGKVASAVAKGATRASCTLAKYRLCLKCDKDDGSCPIPAKEE